MGRTKKITNVKKYYDPFPKRLRELLDRPGETQGKLADFINVNRQSIGQWKDGTTSPDINALDKIAEYYNVSADYLLGRSDVASPNVTIQAIHEKTGLSDKAIEELMRSKSAHEIISKDERYPSFVIMDNLNLLSKLICMPEFYNIMSSIDELKRDIHEIALPESKTKTTPAELKKAMNVYDYNQKPLETKLIEAKDWFKYRRYGINEEFNKLVESLLKKVEELD